MSARFLDEPRLILLAAAATRRSPEDVVAGADLRGAAAVVDDVERAPDAIRAAATALSSIARRRPFASGNAAAAWFTCAFLAPEGARRLSARRRDLVDVIVRIGEGVIDIDTLESMLHGRSDVPVPWPCPACGRALHTDSRYGGRGATWLGPSRLELTARCAVEHRAHDRHGRTLTVTPAAPHEEATRWRPALRNHVTDAIVAIGDDGALLLTPNGEEFVVGVVDDLTPGDLVGDWRPLHAKARIAARIPARDVVVDAHRGLVDVASLAVVGAGAG